MISPKRVFTWGGIFGLVMLTPMFFLESQMAAMGGPITRPENYYGFIGVAWAWQWVYLLIGRDPVRYRPIMPIGADAVERGADHRFGSGDCDPVLDRLAYDAKHASRCQRHSRRRTCIGAALKIVA
jgi:hypothetical protein